MLTNKVKLPKLRQSRRAHKLSIPALAKKARVTGHAVYWAEHGRAVITTVATSIARALSVQLKSLRG